MRYIVFLILLVYIILYAVRILRRIGGGVSRVQDSNEWIHQSDNKQSKSPGNSSDIEDADFEEIN